VDALQDAQTTEVRELELKTVQRRVASRVSRRDAALRAQLLLRGLAAHVLRRLHHRGGRARRGVRARGVLGSPVVRRASTSAAPPLLTRTHDCAPAPVENSARATTTTDRVTRTCTRQILSDWAPYRFLITKLNASPCRHRTHCRGSGGTRRTPVRAAARCPRTSRARCPLTVRNARARRSRSRVLAASDARRVDRYRASRLRDVGSAAEIK
jgi:hypothetical protein